MAPKETREDNIQSLVRNSFNRAELADVTIYLRDIRLPAHSIVLASQSEYFATALKGEFKESATKEFRYGDKDESLQAYWRVFKYIYTGEYCDDSMPYGIPDDEELAKDVRVYNLADYFVISGLKEYALGRFKEKIEKLWVSEVFADCIKDVYQSTNGTDVLIRNAVLNICYPHLSTLWKKKTFLSLYHEGGDFAVDLMGSMVRLGFKKDEGEEPRENEGEEPRENEGEEPRENEGDVPRENEGDVPRRTRERCLGRTRERSLGRTRERGKCL